MAEGHDRVSIKTVDGMTLGRHNMPAGSIGPGLWACVVQCLMPSMGPGYPSSVVHLVVEIEARCSTQPGDFDDVERYVRFVSELERTGACRVYWASHRCTLPRGHAEGHRCRRPDCEPYRDPQAWGPDVEYDGIGA